MVWNPYYFFFDSIRASIQIGMSRETRLQIIRKSRLTGSTAQHSPLHESMTHVGTPSAEEINGNLIALNALAGIPLSEIQGFRAPYLNYSADTLKLLAQAQFTYDSSAASSIPVTDPNTDAYWPYTLDYGMANNCLEVPGTCRGEPKLPGFWEIPMYAFFDDRGVAGPHLMDPWL
jgi:hypothetical protein